MRTSFMRTSFGKVSLPLCPPLRKGTLEIFNLTTPSSPPSQGGEREGGFWLRQCRAMINSLDGINNFVKITVINKVTNTAHD
jgi:hypothetical protein